MIKDIIKLSSVLVIISALAAFSLAKTNAITKDKIAVLKQKKNADAVAFVLKDLQFDYNTQKTIKLSNGEEVLVWEGKDAGGDVKAFAFKCSKYGYSSNVETMAGVDKEGNILGIKILSQTETPGLGTRVNEVASNDTFWLWIAGKSKEATPDELIPWFQKQFLGLTVNNNIKIVKGKGEWLALSDDIRSSLKSNNEITAMAGATITTRAVTEAINEVAKEVLTNLK